MFVGKASSAKKVARLAQKGKGRKVRFQGGTLFPAVMVGIALVGAGLVVYSRASIPDRNVPPTIEDHWHASYGFYVCDEWLPDLQGAKEEADSAGLVNEQYRRTGIHSHNDGVMHWHPFTSAATGRNAKLGVFLDVYGVDLSDSKLEFPEDQGGNVYEEGVDTCTDDDGNEVEGQLVVYAFDSYDDSEKFSTFITNFDDVRLLRDGMAFVIMFAPPGTQPGLPPSAKDLPQLGAVDSGSTGQPTTTLATDGSAPTDTAVDGSSTTVPASTAPTTTLG